MSATVIMTGHLRFTYRGRKHAAPAKLTATPLDEATFQCELEATLGGKTQKARFTVSDSEQQSAELAQNIRAAVPTWPRPWSELHGVYIDLRVTQP